MNLRECEKVAGLVQASADLIRRHRSGAKCLDRSLDTLARHADRVGDLITESAQDLAERAGRLGRILRNIGQDEEGPGWGEDLTGDDEIVRNFSPLTEREEKLAETPAIRIDPKAEGDISGIMAPVEELILPGEPIPRYVQARVTVRDGEVDPVVEFVAPRSPMESVEPEEAPKSQGLEDTFSRHVSIMQKTDCIKAVCRVEGIKTAAALEAWDFYESRGQIVKEGRGKYRWIRSQDLPPVAQANPVPDGAMGLPDDEKELIAMGIRAIVDFDNCILRGDVEGSDVQRSLFHKIAVKMNGGTNMGMNVEGGGGWRLNEACKAPIGVVPLWGQSGVFLVDVEGVIALAEVGSWLMGSPINFHAINLDEAFISTTGFQSVGILADHEGTYSVLDVCRNFLETAKRKPKGLVMVEEGARKWRSSNPPAFLTAWLLCPEGMAWNLKRSEEVFEPTAAASEPAIVEEIVPEVVVPAGAKLEGPIVMPDEFKREILLALRAYRSQVKAINQAAQALKRPLAMVSWHFEELKRNGLIVESPEGGWEEARTIESAEEAIQVPC